MVTDYALAVASAWFAIRLWRRSRAWAIAFALAGIGSLLGGTYHGFAIEWLWKPTVYAVGLSSFFFLVPFLPLLAIVKFMIYASWMITHDDFRWVIADYGVTLLLLVIVRSPGRRWIAGSVAVSAVGAIVQQSAIPYHNDIFHGIQLVALWMLYRGAPATTSKTAQPSIPPTKTPC